MHNELLFLPLHLTVRALHLPDATVHLAPPFLVPYLLRHAFWISPKHENLGGERELETLAEVRQRPWKS